MATYASYIWTCYGITAVVLVLNVWLARRKHSVELTALHRREQTKGQESSQ